MLAGNIARVARVVSVLRKTASAPRRDLNGPAHAINARGLWRRELRNFNRLCDPAHQDHHSRAGMLFEPVEPRLKQLAARSRS